MKKIIAILLCVLILAALTVSVFADNGTPETTVPSPTTTSETSPATEPNQDHGNTSPATGETNLVVYGLVILVAVAGVVFSAKKLAKNQY